MERRKPMGSCITGAAMDCYKLSVSWMVEGLVTKKWNAGEENIQEISNSVLMYWVYSYARTPRWRFKHMMEHTGVPLRKEVIWTSPLEAIFMFTIVKAGWE